MPRLNDINTVLSIIIIITAINYNIINTALTNTHVKSKVSYALFRCFNLFQEELQQNVTDRTAGDATTVH